MLCVSLQRIAYRSKRTTNFSRRVFNGLLTGPDDNLEKLPGTGVKKYLTSFLNDRRHESGKRPETSSGIFADPVAECISLSIALHFEERGAMPDSHPAGQRRRLAPCQNPHRILV